MKTLVTGWVLPFLSQRQRQLLHVSGEAQLFEETLPDPLSLMTVPHTYMGLATFASAFHGGFILQFTIHCLPLFWLEASGIQSVLYCVVPCTGISF